MTLAMSWDEWTAHDGTALAARVRAGELTPAELAAQAAAGIALTNGPTSAVVEVFDDVVADPLKDGMNPDGVFAGLPYLMKDLGPTLKGRLQEMGSQLMQGNRASADSFLAGKLRQAGLNIIGRTTTPEFGVCSSVENALFVTRNPWNLDYTTCGSSAGSAAMVAAGVVPIAHATDGGGSIRIPAACCGLVGLKPTRGRLMPHREEQLLPVAVTVDGVVTRTVRDTARWFAEAEQRHRSRKLPAMGLVAGPPRRRLRVAAVIDLPDGLPVDIEIDDATRRTFERTAALLEELGHHVEVVTAPVDGTFGDDFVSYFELLAFLTTSTGTLSHGRHVQSHLYSDFTRGMADGFRRDRGRVVGASRRLRRTTRDLADFFGRYDVMLSPVTSTVAPPIGHLANDVAHEELLRRVFAWIPYPPIANAAGTPAISLPLGWDDLHHVPVGAMFGAAAGQDALLVQLAFELETARGGFPTLATGWSR